MKVNEIISEGFWDSLATGAGLDSAAAAIKSYDKTKLDPNVAAKRKAAAEQEAAAAEQEAAAEAQRIEAERGKPLEMSPAERSRAMAQKGIDVSPEDAAKIQGTPQPQQPAQPQVQPQQPAAPGKGVKVDPAATAPWAQKQIKAKLAAASAAAPSAPAQPQQPATAQGLSLAPMESKLTEGGNVWDDVGPIKKEYVPGVIKKIQNLMPKGVSIIPHIGSAGFKVQSGDMDVFVDAEVVARTFKAKDEKAAKLALKQYIESKGFECAQSGRNVHVKMPVPDGSSVQVDIMVIPNADRVAPFHQHGPSGQYDDPEFKGGQLFIMYSSLAKALGLKFSPFEGKLVDRSTNKVVADNKDAVAKILLNPKATSADLASVKMIIKALANDPNREAKLAQAKDDAKKGLISLPESVTPAGTSEWFRRLAEIVGPK